MIAAGGTGGHIYPGIAVAQEIRRRGDTTPIIAMTASVFDSDREASLAAGMDAHLAKPINRSLLEQTLVEWISSGQEATAP